MLCVDCNRNVVWNDSAAPTSAHDCYEHILGPDGVPLELLIFRRGHLAAFSPAKFICNSVVNSQNSNAFVHKFAMK